VNSLRKLSDAGLRRKSILNFDVETDN